MQSLEVGAEPGGGSVGATPSDQPEVAVPRGRQRSAAGSCGRERRRSIGFNIKGHVKAALTINGAEAATTRGFPKIRPPTSVAAAHGRKRGLPRAISSDRDKTGHGASSVDPRHMNPLRPPPVHLQDNIHLREGLHHDGAGHWTYRCPFQAVKCAGRAKQIRVQPRLGGILM